MSPQLRTSIHRRVSALPDSSHLLRLRLLFFPHRAQDLCLWKSRPTKVTSLTQPQMCGCIWPRCRGSPKLNCSIFLGTEGGPQPCLSLKSIPKKKGETPRREGICVIWQQQEDRMPLIGERGDEQRKRLGVAIMVDGARAVGCCRWSSHVRDDTMYTQAGAN